MTMCAAWLRKNETVEELVFATDSCLTGTGEKITNGLKLFDLGRSDCLICFAGDTHIAYPFVQNLISSMKFNPILKDQHTDITNIIPNTISLFNELNKLIKDEIKVNHNKSVAKFLFGGWSWGEQKFKVWKIEYSETEKVMKSHEIDIYTENFIFLGDKEYEGEAIELVNKEKSRFGKPDSDLDMEPLSAICMMSKDKLKFSTIDGSPQIAKIHKSSSIEFFGIMWQTSEGKPHFLGRKVSKYELHDTKIFDPDTMTIIEDELYEKLPSYFQDSFKIDEADINLLNQYYPSGYLKKDLTSNEKKQLMTIFKEYGYKLLKETIGAQNSVESSEVTDEELARIDYMVEYHLNSESNDGTDEYQLQKAVSKDPHFIDKEIEYKTIEN